MTLKPVKKSRGRRGEPWMDASLIAGRLEFLICLFTAPLLPEFLLLRELVFVALFSWLLGFSIISVLLDMTKEEDSSPCSPLHASRSIALNELFNSNVLVYRSGSFE